MKIKFRRGGTGKSVVYTGPEGTLSIDTDRHLVYTHDGETVGGRPATGLPEAIRGGGEVYAIEGGEWVPVNTEELVIDNGPGPNELIGGDLSAGFYGTLSADELFYGDELALEVGLAAGDAVNNDSDWLKFAHQGKTLFTPMRPLRSYLTWRDLYQAGLVYGTDDDGLFPDPVDSPVNQLTVVTKGRSTFKVRLFKGVNNDPTDRPAGNATEDPYGIGSEWNELLYRVCIDVPPEQVGSNWAEYTQIQLGMADPVGYAWCQESDVSGARRILRLYLDHTVLQSPVWGISSSFWRPVLELVTV